MEGVELKCSFCQKDYDLEQHAPIALFCGHSYGRSCAVRNSGLSPFICCACGEIEDRNPLDIPTNYSLKQIIEFRNKPIGSKSDIIKSIKEQILHYEHKLQFISNTVTESIHDNTRTYNSFTSTIDDHIRLLNEIKTNFEQTYYTEQKLISNNTLKYKDILRQNIDHLKECEKSIQRTENPQTMQIEYNTTLNSIKSRATTLELKKFTFKNSDDILSNSISSLISNFSCETDKVTFYMDESSSPSANLPQQLPNPPPNLAADENLQNVPNVQLEESSAMQSPIRDPVRGYYSMFNQHHREHAAGFY